MATKSFRIEYFDEEDPEERVLTGGEVREYNDNLNDAVRIVWDDPELESEGFEKHLLLNALEDVHFESALNELKCQQSVSFWSHETTFMRITRTV